MVKTQKWGFVETVNSSIWLKLRIDIQSHEKIRLARSQSKNFYSIQFTV